MAGTISLSEGFIGGIQVKTLTWTSDASGDVNGTTWNWAGAVLRVVTNPGATAPTDDWDLVLNDADGVDVLGGSGANRDTANSEQIIPTNIPFIAGSIELRISNAGNAKNGTVVIYLK